ncbi:PEP-CTERM sorting domain-containing protein [Massilia sp. W12]|uniref:PEP-CTERM sorting domain-containing protein n=1 Tax=Massilia sp. W12 TaxID=3126507 RepID=UPI0030CFAF9C
MLKIAKKIAVAAVLAASFGSAHAALVNAPLPSNAYITIGGLQWAWAFPLPAASGLDLSYQAQFGWHVPTAAELANAPRATDFIFQGANVPLGGTDSVSGARFSATNPNLTGAAACAAPYFSNTYSHCDWQDGLGQIYGPWAGQSGAPSWADQLVVRAAVPEAETYAMMGVGLLGLLALRRRKSA